MQHEVYKRETNKRIFVVRSLQMEKIKFFGFDMDYTLAMYKSPMLENVTFEIIKEKLIEIGYPPEIDKYKYDASFPVRGLWFDKDYGTLLKMDQFGNILLATHGFRILEGKELRCLYPNKFMKLNESRFFVLNTLFNIPETYMLACLVHYFTQNENYSIAKTGVKCDDFFMSYKSIFQDVRNAIDWMHDTGVFRERTVQNLDAFVERDERLPILLDKIKMNNKKIFLLTNSDYQYTDKIMTFLMDFPDSRGHKKPWTQYFDFVLVSALKPLFFKEGTILRTADQQTGKLNIGHHIGPLARGKIYAGGNCETFSELIGAVGKDVLYVGDHIFGDILKSKKTVGWRTFLVIPELVNEITVWKDKRASYSRLQALNNELAMAYKDMDIESEERPPNVSATQKAIYTVAEEMESAYGYLGSLFRNGSRQTFFASQVTRYADVYSHSALNLMYYPLNYMFRAEPILMPHESRVSHEEEECLDEVREEQEGGTETEEVPSLRSRHSIVEADFYKTSGNRSFINGGDNLTTKTQLNGTILKEQQDDEEEEEEEEELCC